MIADEQLTILLRRDWAVRVLDAWAKKSRMARRWECIDAGVICYCKLWERPAPMVAGYGDGARQLKGETPESARLAAAEAVWPELPESVREELGEKP